MKSGRINDVMWTAPLVANQKTFDKPREEDTMVLWYYINSNRYS